MRLIERSVGDASTPILRLKIQRHFNPSALDRDLGMLRLREV